MEEKQCECVSILGFARRPIISSIAMMVPWQALNNSTMEILKLLFFNITNSASVNLTSQNYVLHNILNIKYLIIFCWQFRDVVLSEWNVGLDHCSAVQYTSQQNWSSSFPHESPSWKPLHGNLWLFYEVGSWKFQLLSKRILSFAAAAAAASLLNFPNFSA